MLTLAEQDNLTRWHRQKPFYEVYYLKFNDVTAQTAAWLRYTLLVSENRPAEASVWGIFFDAQDPKKNFFLKETFPIEQLRIEHDFFYFAPGPSALFQEGARGKIAQQGHSLAWELQFSDSVSLQHYPSLLYHLPLPKTKLLAPHVSVKVSGTLTVDEKSYSLNQVKGHQAHFWGTEQAARWAWANCNTFVEDPTAIFEGFTAQIRLGTNLSPPLSLFFFWLDGKCYRFNLPHHWYRNQSRYDRQSWHLETSAGNLYLVADISARPEDQMEVPYEDPNGSGRMALNTKLANLRIDVFEKLKGQWCTKRRLTAQRSVAFEVVESS